MSKITVFKVLLGLMIIVTLSFAIALVPGAPTRDFLVNMFGLP